ncbi:gp88 [Sphingomonas phage PAU]|uniref:gp88 n=1 Tax=Sphingomonas phage PAU TaxID=1150991 RepID=UPI00025731E2|nr:gp88 [Sphingomonas phage PAU]AFF28086.1 gp88 [Sphingomonas phage PAU]
MIPYPHNRTNDNSINFQFNQKQERIVYFDLSFEDSSDLLESIDLIFDIKELNVQIHYGYSLDSDNWSQFYIDFQLFKSHVNEQINQGFETFIRIKIKVDKEDERNYNVLANNYDTVMIEQIDINSKKARISKIEVPFADNSIIKRKTTNLWKPYNGMEKATKIWKNISYAINNVVGFYVWYFKVQSDKSNRSISLKSYRLKNVSDLKKIKILIPDNEIPDNANIFSEYGITFNDEMTFHILDEVFIEAFTKEAGGPQQHDFLYFPLTNRMYEVNNAYPVKEFMQEYVKWQVSLVKYEKSDIVNLKTEDDETVSFEEQINEWINFQDKNLEQVESFEEIQKSTPDYYNMDVLEATRSALHKDLEIIEYPMYNKTVKLFSNWYRLSMVPKDELAVSYKARNTKPDNISISFWMYQETRSSKPLFKTKSDKGNSWLDLDFKQGKIVLSINGVSLLTSNVSIESKKKYCICVNWSNQYQYCSMIIMEYDDSTRSITNIDTETVTVRNYTELLNSIEIFGGQHLISAMTLRKRTIDEANAKELLLTTQPNSDDVIFHDKCDTVGSDIRSRL